MVMLSTASLKAERLGEFLIERGREFQLRGRGNKGVGPCWMRDQETEKAKGRVHGDEVRFIRDC